VSGIPVLGGGKSSPCVQPRPEPLCAQNPVKEDEGESVRVVLDCVCDG
jgi:hypothetical protein